jgi:hypothetical protein
MVAGKQQPPQSDHDMVATPATSSSSSTAAAAEAVLRSRDADDATRLLAVKRMKNTVIGNRFKKLQHLDAVPLLLELLASHSGSGGQSPLQDPAAGAELAVQAAAALGSLAYGVEDGVRAIVAAGGVRAILAALSSSEGRVVVAAARALKLVYQVRVGWVGMGGCGWGLPAQCASPPVTLHPHAHTLPTQSPVAPHEPLLAAPTLQRLVALLALQPPQLPAATAAASVLARVCTAPDEVRLCWGRYARMGTLVHAAHAAHPHTKPRLTNSCVCPCCVRQAAKLVDAGAVAALVPLLTVSSRACQVCAVVLHVLATCEHATCSSVSCLTHASVRRKQP